MVLSRDVLNSPVAEELHNCWQNSNSSFIPNFWINKILFIICPGTNLISIFWIRKKTVAIRYICSAPASAALRSFDPRISGRHPGSVSSAGESECHRAGASLPLSQAPSPLSGDISLPTDPYPPSPSLPGSWALVQTSCPPTPSSPQGRPLPAT